MDLSLVLDEVGGGELPEQFAAIVKGYCCIFLCEFVTHGPIIQSHQVTSVIGEETLK
jgi:hypothetical protein